MEALQIERACVRLDRALQHRKADEITLLRAARTLKPVNERLKRALHRQMGVCGRTPELARADAALEASEQRLRHVLLEHQSLGEQEMRAQLHQAVHRAWDALDLLQSRKKVI